MGKMWRIELSFDLAAVVVVNALVWWCLREMRVDSAMACDVGLGNEIRFVVSWLERCFEMAQRRISWPLMGIEVLCCCFHCCLGCERTRMRTSGRCSGGLFRACAIWLDDSETILELEPRLSRSSSLVLRYEIEKNN